jgi:energy-coupling factor transport system permease protein
MLDNRYIYLGGYYNEESYIHKFNPSIKIIITLVLIISLIISTSILDIIILNLFILVVLFLSKIKLKTYIKTILKYTLLLITIFIISLLLAKNIYFSTYLLVKFIDLILILSILIKTTKPLEINMGLSYLLNTKIINLKHLILNITLILIAIPLIEETRREINNSINLRTIQSKKRNIINKIKQNIKNIEPIYRLTKNKIKKIYTVMELKNYSYFANRTKKQYKNKITEFITLLLSVIIFVLIIIY